MRQFVEKCLATVSLRLSARELLNDPFLQIDNCEVDLSWLDCGRKIDDLGPLIRQPYELHHSSNSFSNAYSNGYGYEPQNECRYPPVEVEPNGIELFEYHDNEDNHSTNRDISIKGKRRDDDGIFLRLRIADNEG